MLRLPTEEEKKLRDIFKPYINGCNEKQPLTSDAPPEAVEAFEKWKELSLRLDKEAEELNAYTNLTFSYDKESK